MIDFKNVINNGKVMVLNVENVKQVGKTIDTRYYNVKQELADKYHNETFNKTKILNHKPVHPPFK